MEQGIDTTEEIPLSERQIWACSGERKVDGTPSQFGTTESIGRNCLEYKKSFVQLFLRILIDGIPPQERRGFGASLSDQDHLTEFRCFSPDERLVSKMDFSLDQYFEGGKPIFHSRVTFTLYTGLPNADAIQARLERELYLLETVYGFVLS